MSGELSVGRAIKDICGAGDLTVQGTDPQGAQTAAVVNGLLRQGRIVLCGPEMKNLANASEGMTGAFNRAGAGVALKGLRYMTPGATTAPEPEEAPLYRPARPEGPGFGGPL